MWGGTGKRQIQDSHRLWGVPRFDLIQVHNLLRWENHLETLRAEKAAGRLRYIGVTTSHGRRHDDLESIMKREAIDFARAVTTVGLSGEVDAVIAIHIPAIAGDPMAMVAAMRRAVADIEVAKNTALESISQRSVSLALSSTSIESRMSDTAWTTERLGMKPRVLESFAFEHS